MNVEPQNDQKAPNDTLKEVITRATTGDRDAFRHVFDLGSDKVFRYLMSQLQNREDAHDLLQETFIDLWKGLRNFRYRSDDEFWGFLFLIARRKVYAYRKIPNKTVLVDSDEFDALIPQELHDHPEYEDYRFLHRTLATLGAKSKEVLTLRYWSDLSFAEIARVAGITEGAAKVRHHRALRELEGALEPQ